MALESRLKVGGIHGILDSQAIDGNRRIGGSGVASLVFHIQPHSVKHAPICGPTLFGKFVCELQESPLTSVSNVIRRPESLCTVCLKKVCVKTQEKIKNSYIDGEIRAQKKMKNSYIDGGFRAQKKKPTRRKKKRQKPK